MEVSVCLIYSLSLGILFEFLLNKSFVTYTEIIFHNCCSQWSYMLSSNHNNNSQELHIYPKGIKKSTELFGDICYFLVLLLLCTVKKTFQLLYVHSWLCMTNNMIQVVSWFWCRHLSVITCEIHFMDKIALLSGFPCLRSGSVKNHWEEIYYFVENLAEKFKR